MNSTTPGTFLCLKSDTVIEADAEDFDREAKTVSMKHNCLWRKCSSMRGEGVVEAMEELIMAGMHRRIRQVTREDLHLTPSELESSRIYVAGLFAPQRCKMCGDGIEYGENYSHCFGGECSGINDTYCDKCAKDHSHATYKEKLTRRNPQVAGKSVRHTITNALHAFEHRPVYGWSTRHTRISENGEMYQLTHDGRIQWISFGQFHRRALLFGRGLMKMAGIKQGDFVGHCGVNRLEWPLSNIGCILHNIRGIAIHTTYNLDDLLHLVENAELKEIGRAHV